MGGDAFSDRLAGLLEPVVRAEGFDLEDVVVTPAGRRRLLRVVVDGDEGVSLDDVAVLSHAVSKALDESDAMGARPYVLEVTSPGVERPLIEVRHWRRARGRMVRATLTDGSVVEGRVISADDDGVELSVSNGHGSKGAARSDRYRYATLAGGRVQVEFRSPARDEQDHSAAGGQG